MYMPHAIESLHALDAQQKLGTPSQSSLVQSRHLSDFGSFTCPGLHPPGGNLSVSFWHVGWSQHCKCKQFSIFEQSTFFGIGFLSQLATAPSVSRTNATLRLLMRAPSPRTTTRA